MRGLLHMCPDIIELTSRVLDCSSKLLNQLPSLSKQNMNIYSPRLSKVTNPS